MSIEQLDEWLDNSVKPQNDFFRYVNGKWLDEVEIPEDQSRWGSFTILREQSKDAVKDILEDDLSDEEFKLVTEFYHTAMDEDRINELDIEPIQDYLQMIDSIETREDLINTILALSKEYIPTLFSFRSFIDRKNAEQEVPHLSSGGISLPNPNGATNKDYYFEDDKEEIRNKYVDYLKTILTYADVGNSEQIAPKVLEFEKQLAETHYTQVQKRDPELSYNKMEVEELGDLVPNFDWDTYFSNFTDTEITFLIVDNPNFFKLINKMLETESLDNWKAYLKARVINTSANYLSERFEKAHFELYGKTIKGAQEQEPRWKRVQDSINSPFILGHLIGKVYVERHFSTEAKEQMLELVTNIQSALRERIKQLSWMSDQTKEKALEKLDAFGVKIGYPDEWKDYQDMDISQDYSYLKNLKNAIKFNMEENLSRLYKEPDPNQWYMSPQTVNAYYSPSRNEIVFPAAILQYPFFDINMTAEENYGGIGGVIAHEVTHGFDDKGSMFDARGNMENWWTEADKTKFEEKGKHFVEQYSEYLVNDKPVNGELTLGENIADHGGVRIAYHALQKHWEDHGKSTNSTFSPDERFFMSWARIWRGKYRPEAAEMLRSSDPHSPPKARVNVTLANIKEFHKVFNTQPDDEMYRQTLQDLW